MLVFFKAKATELKVSCPIYCPLFSRTVLIMQPRTDCWREAWNSFFFILSNHCVCLLFLMKRKHSNLILILILKKYREKKRNFLFLFFNPLFITLFTFDRKWKYSIRLWNNRFQASKKGGGGGKIQWKFSLDTSLFSFKCN